MYDKGMRRAVRTRAAVLALCGLVLLPPAAAAPARGDHASIAATARASATAAAAKVWQGAQDIALFALGMIGVDYRFGGETPDRGLDCSGLIRYVFQQVTGTTLPRTSREMSRLGDKVSMAELQPGDLVFFNTRRFAFSHVGLYLGDNRFIHAPSTGGEVEIATLSQGYWKKRFDGARRLVGVLPTLVPTMIESATAAPLQPPAVDPAPDALLAPAASGGP
jgi:cell wall-associated NlpC family hydrolase